MMPLWQTLVTLPTRFIKANDACDSQRREQPPPLLRDVFSQWSQERIHLLHAPSEDSGYCGFSATTISDQ